MAKLYNFYFLHVCPFHHNLLFCASKEKKKKKVPLAIQIMTLLNSQI